MKLTFKVHSLFSSLPQADLNYTIGSEATEVCHRGRIFRDGMEASFIARNEFNPLILTESHLIRSER